MAEFRIAQWDKDYHTVVDTEIKEFDTKELANGWCKQVSGGGYKYFVVNKPTYECEDYPE